ncbi:30S ribosomal protein S18 [Mycobacterium yunnanensis]|uniref:Small ribosomal subunit protein bS18 n=1 Tax=Mycobacterium yunnanensis TaxID=368477 RepID=A0A9X3BW19_9MYCO|nr:30S ribosomal protein S18 [Mycobacterium yunnanensis]MCV7423905.1 30S ribosomal protein S18 [Mycobacterium yunnanensis]
MAQTKPNRTRSNRNTERKPVKRNALEALGVDAVDYKDTVRLRTFISDRGKIRSRAVTGLTVQQQRQVAAAIKNAREMALLPYPGQSPPGPSHLRDAR